MTRDKITVTGVTGYGYHGVLAAEKREGQEFVVDAALELDVSSAGTSDDLRHTIDYGQVAELIHGQIVSDPVDLIETLAERTARLILQNYPLVQRVELTVNKPHAPITVPFTNVAVTVVRER
ncbi:MAG: dihydroneopterin aldolase [Kocuria sp.]|nr:dihydroneopterin aldolase [Kocuria sp.]